jgi:hypothetical protein
LNKTEPVRESAQAFGMLRGLARSPVRRLERCELCKAELRAEHSHLVELERRRLVCACEACAILFSGAGGKYRRVPREVRLLAAFQLSDAEWDSLLIPINLAFFFHSNLNRGVSALYPSPAGATESLLPLGAWDHIVRANPVLADLQPDVEALLVNRVGHARGSAAAEYYIVPIDVCYRLVGLIRLHWRGLGGGTEVWQEIGEFFSGLRSRAETVTEANRA